jgi:hypothetical protein
MENEAASAKKINLASQHLATKYDFLSQFFKLAVLRGGWYVMMENENRIR